MWNKIIKRSKLPVLTNKKQKSSWVLNQSIQGQKAVVLINNKPVFGTVSKVMPVPAVGGSYPTRVFIKMLTVDEQNISFEAMGKLAVGEFKLISNDVFEKLPHLSIEQVDQVLFKRKTIAKEKKKPAAQIDNRDVSDVKEGDVVETVILSGKHKGIWVRAEVTAVEADTMDLCVLSPRKWKVMRTALSVPKNFIRVILPKDKGNYTIPLEFVMDDKIHYIECNKEMRIKNLKTTVAQLRNVRPNQLIFVNKGSPLLETAPIPNDTIFCIICQKGGLTENQLHLLSNSIQKPTPHTL